MKCPSFWRRALLATIPACFSLLGVVATANATIEYDVSLVAPEQHVFHVSMQIPDVKDEVIVQMPAWNALYQIRDFSAHVQRVEAFTGAQKFPVEKLDKQTWRVKGSGTITIRYATYWDEGGPFATQLNADHAFINPAMILMYVPTRRSEPVLLGMADVPSEWQAVGASREVSGTISSARTFLFEAASYDQLVDAPIEAGKGERLDVPGLDPPVRAIVHGDDWKKKRVQDELRRICAYETKLMEGAPYTQYTFIVHFGKAATGEGGGMEHANSTAISVRSDEDFANVAAHEFFHLWNVKRIRPATLDPVDYTKEQYTRALWFAEGVTNTYASYTLVRTGLWSAGQFYEDLGEQISELEERPANEWQSAEQSSLDAWLEKYPLYNRPQNSVSYYTKGQILGVLLDILIRDRTGNEKSLDDVLRSMNQEFGKQDKAYRDSLDVRLTAEKVAGGSFEDFFQKYVAGAEPLPYGPVFNLAGLELKTLERRHPAIGFSAGRDETGALIVRSIDPNGGAEQAGLRVDDVITSWNGAEPPRSPERWAYSQKKGNLLKLGIRRDDKNITLQLRLGESVETFYRVADDAYASEKARHIRDGLLHGVTQPVTASIH
ncbi:MAG: PDZ domain-containing protein [Candidatus Acidiferrum sp.]